MHTCIEQGSGGDAATGSFAVFAEAVGPTLRRYFFRASRDRELSSDLAQETLLRLFRAYGRGTDDGGEGPAPWEKAMWTAARRLWVDTLRSRRPSVSLEALGEAAERRESDEEVRAELLDLALGLRRLAAEQRAALMLQAEGLSRAEIGARLGRTDGAVQELLRSGRRSLRDALGTQAFVLPGTQLSEGSSLTEAQG